jgi:excisionase family DNA binding protein
MKERNQGENKLLTVKQAAALLRVSIGTLRRWDDSGKFPARRHPINGYRLYRDADVRRLKRLIEGSIAAESRR